MRMRAAVDIVKGSHNQIGEDVQTKVDSFYNLVAPRMKHADYDDGYN